MFLFWVLGQDAFRDASNLHPHKTRPACLSYLISQLRLPLLSLPPFSSPISPTLTCESMKMGLHPGLRKALEKVPAHRH